MRELLELNGIYIKSIDKYRLENISLKISGGEKVALIGKSGSGKSTLIKVSNGSIKPLKGTVRWNGNELKELSRIQMSEIGTLWQELRLINELSVSQNINTGCLYKHNFIWAILNLLGSLNREETYYCFRAMKLAKSLIHKNINSLSGGQKQRVAIARLLIQEAKLNLIDEPFSNLDPKISNEVLDILLNRHKIKKINIANTCLISLHRPELIKNFTRVIGLKDAKINFDLPVDKVSKELINKIYS